MKRTKEWWAKLNINERSLLALFERLAKRSYQTPYYPDDCWMCGFCGDPTIVAGLCVTCSNDYEFILDKADAA